MYVGRNVSKNSPPGDSAFGTTFVKDGWGWADINQGFSIDGASVKGIQNDSSNSGTVTIKGRFSMNCTNDSELFSFHIGGVPFLFGDGSIQFYSQNADLQSLVSALTPAGGDIPLDSER